MTGDTYLDYAAFRRRMLLGNVVRGVNGDRLAGCATNDPLGGPLAGAVRLLCALDSFGARAAKGFVKVASSLLQGAWGSQGKK